MEKYSPENESQKYKIHTSQKCNADLNRVFTALNIYIYYMYIYIMYILQINAIIIKGYVAFYVYRLFCTYFVKIYTEYFNVLKKYSLFCCNF